MMSGVVFVAGTGTGIGKTTVCCAWLRGLPGSVGFKPIESGGDGDSRALGDSCHQRLRPLYSFVDPVSPHLAARRVAESIDFEHVAERVRGLPRPLLIESAGGLFSPLRDDGATNADLALHLGAHLVLVAPNRLGVLHDAISATRAAAAMGLRVAAIVVSGGEGVVGDESTESNARELRRFIAMPVVELSGAAFTEDALRRVNECVGFT